MPSSACNKSTLGPNVPMCRSNLRCCFRSFCFCLRCNSKPSGTKSPKVVPLSYFLLLIDVVVVVDVVFAVAIAIVVVGHLVCICAPGVCVVVVVESLEVERSKGLPRTRFNNLIASVSFVTHKFQELVAGFHDVAGAASGAAAASPPPSTANAFFAFRQSREK